MQLSTPGDFDDVEICHASGNVGEVASQKLTVAPFGAVTRYAPAAGWSRWAAPDGPHGRTPRRHAALKPLHDGLASPARDHRPIGVHPNGTNALGIDVRVE
jgi:hypothetical protein